MEFLFVLTWAPIFFSHQKWVTRKKRLRITCVRNLNGICQWPGSTEFNTKLSQTKNTKMVLDASLLNA